MPTYDYKCKACGHQFEAFQSMTESPKRKCPSCGKNALERLIGTGAAVLFKGSGFYQTDYRSESYKKAAEADKPAGESKSESKDGKAATTTDAKSAPEKGKSETKPASPPPAPAPKEKKPKAKT
jgi:putative FmdB family regulatory protein